ATVQQQLGGSANAAPLWKGPFVAECRHRFVCSFGLPATDADGDPLSFRFATDAETMANPSAKFHQPGPCPALGKLHPLPPMQAPWANHPGCEQVMDPSHTLQAARLDVVAGKTIFHWDTENAFRASVPTYYSTHIVVSDGQAEASVELQVHLRPACGCSLLSLPAYVKQMVNHVWHEAVDKPTHAATFTFHSVPPGATVHAWSSGTAAHAQFQWEPPLSSLGQSPVVAAHLMYATPERTLHFPCFLHLTPLALPPVVLPLGVQATPQGTTLVSPVHASDPQGLPLQVGVLQAPVGGTLSYFAPAKELHYTPNPGFVGYDHFTLKVDNGWTSPQSVAGIVLVVPDAAPLVHPDVVLVAPAAPTLLPHDFPLANDVSTIGAPLTWEVVQPPQGTLVPVEQGKLPGAALRYEPPAGGLTQDDVMTYRAVHYGRASETVEVRFRPLLTVTPGLQPGTYTLPGPTRADGPPLVVLADQPPAQEAVQEGPAQGHAASSENRSTASPPHAPAGSIDTSGTCAWEGCVRPPRTAAANPTTAALPASQAPDVLPQVLLMAGLGLLAGPAVVMLPRMLRKP
ncbi:MAG TPA: Ig-like domain-containing protein, partial [Candidatus Thermoplasmatota archaeon]|nr:Ig-like domain-containing protein [Candidatus Thermoplasmatota archaeon]